MVKIRSGSVGERLRLRKVMLHFDFFFPSESLRNHFSLNNQSFYVFFLFFFLISNGILKEI